MRPTSFAITVIAASALTACSPNEEKERQSLMEVSKQELATALQERDQLLELVKEVSQGLEQIKELENIMTTTVNAPSEIPGQKDRILADMEKLKRQILKRKAKLVELERKLSKSTLNTRDLQETVHALRLQMDTQIEQIDVMRRQLTDANRHIGMLNHTVDSLSTTVNAVTGERNAAQETSARLENELNTCYFLIATKSELKNHRIIESGFLRKTRLLKGDFDKGCFTRRDKRTFASLPLGTAKATVLTSHPDRSYELTDENGEKVLRILNPDQFWSLSNYLVIQKSR